MACKHLTFTSWTRYIQIHTWYAYTVYCHVFSDLDVRFGLVAGFIGLLHSSWLHFTNLYKPSSFSSYLLNVLLQLANKEWDSKQNKKKLYKPLVCCLTTVFTRHCYVMASNNGDSSLGMGVRVGATTSQPLQTQTGSDTWPQQTSSRVSNPCGGGLKYLHRSPCES
jgi:hypothetical protein